MPSSSKGPSPKKFSRYNSLLIYSFVDNNMSLLSKHEINVLYYPLSSTLLLGKHIFRFCWKFHVTEILDDEKFPAGIITFSVIFEDSFTA